MDFITGLPQVQGKDCIYMVVDRLTKFVLKSDQLLVSFSGKILGQEPRLISSGMG